MKLIRSKPLRSPTPQKEEQGVTMVLALFMGLVLITGATGLLVRQLAARKLASSESFQQMAENAAINGFNRILGEVNSDDDRHYKGYFLTIRNDAQSWGWRDPNSAESPLVELCTDTGFSLTADPLSDSLADAPPIQLKSVNNSITNQRNDKKDKIQLYYRLRGYVPRGNGENGDEGTFEIEGIVQRTTDRHDDNSYLARTLLTRSIYIDQRVAGAGDWAVMGGYYMRLGNANISGAGKILLDVDATNASSYRSGDGCSNESLLKKVGASTVNFKDRDQLAARIWPVLERGLPTTDLFMVEPDPLDPDKAKDKMSRTSSDVRVWSFDDSTTPTSSRCGKTACVRAENSSQFQTPSSVQANAETIVIEQGDICPGSSSFECHMYVEHMNLSNTKILIETGGTNSPRPVVIHLELPRQNSTRITDISGNITLSENSTFCGVNTGSTACNAKPERFVISAAAGTDNLSCDESNHVLDFHGNSLPHAIVHLPKGTVRPTANATLHGVIWAQNICTDSVDFTLETSDFNEPVVQKAYTLWKWGERGFPGYGQMVVRGIRGKGLDTFRRW